MFKALQMLVLALQYIPHVLNAVKSVEQVIGSGQGKTKKELIMTAVQAVAQVGAEVPESHVQVISSTIDQVVGVLNKNGVFSTNSTQPAK